jgi:hypothetical protein
LIKSMQQKYLEIGIIAKKFKNPMVEEIPPKIG